MKRPQKCSEGIKKNPNPRLRRERRHYKEIKDVVLKCLRPSWLQDVELIFVLPEHNCGHSVSFLSFHFNSWPPKQPVVVLECPQSSSHLGHLLDLEDLVRKTTEIRLPVRLGHSYTTYTGNMWWEVKNTGCGLFLHGVVHSYCTSPMRLDYQRYSSCSESS